MNDISYNNWPSMSDFALEKTFGEFIKHHRLEQNITQGQLSEHAGISRSTLSLLERGKTVTLSTYIKALRALNLLHVMDHFQVQNEISPILLAEIQRDKRTRASSAKSKPLK